MPSPAELLVAWRSSCSCCTRRSLFLTRRAVQCGDQDRRDEPEGPLGLELLRKDLESLGYGLTWNNLVANGIVGASPSFRPERRRTPRGPSTGSTATRVTVNRSDYLSIKSDRVGMDGAAGKWTTLSSANVKRSWVPATENLQNADYVVVMSAGGLDTTRRSLITSGTFYTQFSDTAGFTPAEPYTANLVYGIGATVPARPFNRADYFVSERGGPVALPRRTRRPGEGRGPAQRLRRRDDLPPLLDCVADIAGGLLPRHQRRRFVESPIKDIAAAFPAGLLGAANMRDQLREIRVYILAQEGTAGRRLRYPDPRSWWADAAVGNNFNVAGSRNYRWKVYTLAVKPANLAQ